ncbi:MAG: hypothetical protein ACKVH7_05450 [Alphaproteobacteria bacterium]
MIGGSNLRNALNLWRIAWIKWLFVGAFASTLAPSEALAQTPQDPLSCDDVSVSLICNVLADMMRELEAYSEALARITPSGTHQFDPLFLSERLMAANGQLSRAILSSEDFHDHLNYEVSKLGLSSLAYLSEVEWDIVTDPQPRADPEEIEELLNFDYENLSSSMQIAVAKALVGTEHDQTATMLYERAAEFRIGIRARHTDPIYTVWAASGQVAAALDHANELTGTHNAFALLGIVEGVALSGDVAQVAALVEALPGDLPVLGELALAEAYRRSGDDSTARGILDAAQESIALKPAGIRGRRADVRLAQGYALLGDLETAIALVGPYTERSMSTYFWGSIAPHIACHDLDRAIGLIAEKRFDGASHYNQSSIVDVLVAGAASGHIEIAHAFAMQEEGLLKRTLYLVAVVTGIHQYLAVPMDAAPCWTLSFLPS